MRDVSDDTVMKTVQAMLKYLPYFIGILAINRIYVGDYLVFGILMLAIGNCIFLLFQLQKGKGSGAPLFLSILFTVFITIICTNGNGVHDVGIMAYPVTLGFSSIILRRNELLLTFFITVLGIAWLVLGEMNGFFTIKAISSATHGDFVIIGTFIGIGSFLTYTLTGSIRASLANAKIEYARSINAAAKLKKEVEEKSLLIQQIHRKAIKSLNYIGKLSETSNSIHRKIISIESAHTILDQTNDYEFVDLSKYFQLLIERYNAHYGKKLRWTQQISNVMLGIDDTISFGICFLEMVHQVEDDETNHIRLDKKNDEVHLHIECPSIKSLKPGDPSKFLMETMALQLKANLTVQPSQKRLVWKLIFKIK